MFKHLVTSKNPWHNRPCSTIALHLELLLLFIGALSKGLGKNRGHCIFIAGFLGFILFVCLFFDVQVWISQR